MGRFAGGDSRISGNTGGLAWFALRLIVGEFSQCGSTGADRKVYPCRHGSRCAERSDQCPRRWRSCCGEEILAIDIHRRGFPRAYGGAASGHDRRTTRKKRPGKPFPTLPVSAHESWPSVRFDRKSLVVETFPSRGCLGHEGSPVQIFAGCSRAVDEHTFV
jgi:hypothetical protein